MGLVAADIAVTYIGTYHLSVIMCRPGEKYNNNNTLYLCAYNYRAYIIIVTEDLPRSRFNELDNEFETYSPGQRINIQRVADILCYIAFTGKRRRRWLATVTTAPVTIL